MVKLEWSNRVIWEYSDEEVEVDFSDNTEIVFRIKGLKGEIRLNVEELYIKESTYHYITNNNYLVLTGDNKLSILESRLENLIY